MVQSTFPLCANRYTGQVTSPGSGSCLPTTIAIEPVDTSFCINRYTGQVRYLSGHACPGTFFTHTLPDDGDLLTCVNRYTGANRWVLSHDRCTSVERPNTIPASP